MSIAAFGVETAHTVIDRILSDGERSSEFWIAILGLMLMAGGAFVEVQGKRLPLSFYAGTVAIVVAYIISRIWVKDQAARIVKQGAPMLLALGLAACASPLVSDDRFQLAKACEAYGRALVPLAEAVEAGRFERFERDQISAIIDEISPLCESQANVNAASALDAIERALTSLASIQSERI